MTDEFIYAPRIAYFSMEIALRNEIPTYAGGLGILAGDTMRSAADLRLPLVAVSLVSRAGYFRQEIDGLGRQHEQADPWDPARWARSLEAKVAVPIEARIVWVSAWLYVLESHLGGRSRSCCSIRTCRRTHRRIARSRTASTAATMHTG